METESPDIKTYIKRAVENVNFKNCNITLTGATEDNNGYTSDIIFASVSVTTKDGVEESFEVAVKKNKLRDHETQNKGYERESYFYETILPELTRFQKENNIKSIFDSVPKYYKTISDENMYIIVLENLKKRGYELYDRRKPLDLNHMQLVLREYGKLHAISFALREKSKSDFEKLVNNYEDVYLHALAHFISPMFQQRMKVTCDVLKKNNKPELHETCHQILEKGAGVAMTEILATSEPLSAILHGDCWSNNFMFKYEFDDHRFPLNVAILDWQVSRLHSPVLDISYFIYSTCSEEQLIHFDELLNTYYSSFSAVLRELGCDPKILFPYSALKKHWKKYCLYGFLMASLCLPEMVYGMEKPEASYDNAEFLKRFIAIVTHYCKYSH